MPAAVVMTKGEIAGLEGGSMALCGVAGVFGASIRARPTSAFILDKRAHHQQRTERLGSPAGERLWGVTVLQMLSRQYCSFSK